MEPTKFLTENNKKVLENSKDCKLIENISIAFKTAKQKCKEAYSKNQDRLYDFRNGMVEERVDEFFAK